MVHLGVDSRKFSSGLNSARGALSGFSKFAIGAAASIGGVLGTAGLAGTIGFGVKIAAEAEQAKVAFTTLLGSAEAADKMLKEIGQFAASTPFELPELRNAARNLAAFGVPIDKILPNLRMLGDLAAGTNQPIGELAEIFGKAKVQGRLFMEDINQLTGRGIPVIGEFAKMFGVAESEVRSLVEKGKIGFPQLESAIANMTREGGKFGGMMAAQSRTILGMWSTLKDNFSMILGQIGESIIDTFSVKERMQGLIRWMDGFSTALRDMLAPLSNAKKDLGGFGDAAFAQIDIIGNLQTAIGFLADAVQFMRIEFLKGQVAATQFAKSLAQIGLLFTDPMADNKKIRDPEIEKAMRLRRMQFEEIIKDFEKLEAEQKRVAKEVSEQPWNSDKVVEFFNRMKKAATDAAGPVKALRPGQSGQPGGVAGIGPDKDLKKMKSDADSLFKKTRTPVEQLEIEFQKARDLFAEGLIDGDTFNRAMKDAIKNIDPKHFKELQKFFAQQGLTDLKIEQFGKFQTTAGLSLRTSEGQRQAFSSIVGAKGSKIDADNQKAVKANTDKMVAHLRRIADQTKVLNKEPDIAIANF